MRPWAVVSSLFLLALLAGCTSVETHDAFAGDPPADPAELVLDGDVRLIALDGRPIEGFAEDSAPPVPPGDIDTQPRNPKRILRIDPGGHTITAGVARRWMPLLRETHIGVALLTGSVNYSAALYPGSDRNETIAFTAAPGGKYRVLADVPKRGEWSIIFRPIGDGDSRARVVNADVPHEGEGTALRRGEWIVAERERERSAREGGGGSDLTKPSAP